MKTWEEIVRDRQQRYLAILKGANDVHLGWSACDELRMVLESCVPVVRCRDCKHWYEWEHGTGSCHRSENGYNWFGVDATDYCSFGERKEATT